MDLTEFIKDKGSTLTLETVAAKLSYYFEQIHLLHLQTSSHAEHSALNVWEDVVDAKDSILEELMGYEGRKVKAYKIDPLQDYSKGLPQKVLTDLNNFTKQLASFAKSKGYLNIENQSQDLSGKVAKTLYLLTQS